MSAVTPRLTVIVPTYNRAPIVDKCLDALFRQTLPGSNFEVIVADDGSSDHTRDVAEKYSARQKTGGGPAVSHSFAPNAGANAARNRAVRIAKGSILLLINDDTIAEPRMLEEHLATHDRFPEGQTAVLGRVTHAPDLPPSRLAALHLDRAYEAIGERTELDWRWFFTCNISVKRSLLERHGLFEEKMRYHEDLELSERLSHQGLRVIYNSAALGYHWHCLTEDEFLGVARREARALVVWARKSPRLLPVLAEFGFEPALSSGARLKNHLRSTVVNRATIPFWAAVARRCPARMEALALKVYLQIYQSEKRACLLQELRAGS